VVAPAFDLIAGNPALDFANTVSGDRFHAPREKLNAYGDLLAFARQADLIDAASARALADRFRPLADEIAREDQPREGSFFDRIAQSASHLVRIRSASEKPGSDPAAIASQIQAALDRGDIASARDLWTKLPDRSKARAADFGRALEARVAADSAAQALASESIARLAKPRS